MKPKSQVVYSPRLSWHVVVVRWWAAKPGGTFCTRPEVIAHVPLNELDELVNITRVWFLLGQWSNHYALVFWCAGVSSFDMAVLQFTLGELLLKFTNKELLVKETHWLHGVVVHCPHFRDGVGIVAKCMKLVGREVELAFFLLKVDHSPNLSTSSWNCCFLMPSGSGLLRELICPVVLTGRLHKLLDWLSESGGGCLKKSKHVGCVNMELGISMPSGKVEKHVEHTCVVWLWE